MSSYRPFPMRMFLASALSLPCIVAGCIGDSFTEVHGVVVDANGAPLSGATVTLRPKEGEERLSPPGVTTSHADGHFWVGLSHQPVDTQFVVESKKNGFLTSTTMVEACERYNGMRIVMVADKKTQQTTENVQETASEETSGAQDSKEPVVPASKGQ